MQDWNVHVYQIIPPIKDRTFGAKLLLAVTPDTSGRPRWCKYKRVKSRMKALSLSTLRITSKTTWSIVRKVTSMHNAKPAEVNLHWKCKRNVLTIIVPHIWFSGRKCSRKTHKILKSVFGKCRIPGKKMLAPKAITHLEKGKTADHKSRRPRNVENRSASRTYSLWTAPM